MAMTKARRGILIVGVGAAVCIAWLTWAWSPSVEEEPVVHDADEAAPTPVSTAAQPSAPSPSPMLRPAPAPAAPAPAAPAEPATEQVPERVPTPHPMSLDQTKPPEAYGALTELKNQYASESRSAASDATETQLRTLLAEAPNVPAELVQGISCRRTICKLETRWTPHRRIGFAVLLESFKQLYKQRVAVEPAHARSDDGTYLTTLYLGVQP